MENTLEKIKKDFEEIKRIAKEREKNEILKTKNTEWQELSSQYNGILYAAVKDESILLDAVELKEKMDKIQQEINDIIKNNEV